MAKLATLIDNFNDNSINATLWAEFEDSGGSVSETNGQLEITMPNNDSSAEAGLLSQDSFDIVGSGIFLHLKQIGAQPQTGFVVRLSDSSNHFFDMQIFDGEWYVTWNNGSGQQVAGPVATYDEDAEWVRMYESNGEIEFEISADGFVWNNLGSLDLSDDLSNLVETSLKLEISAYADSSANPAGVYIVDNVNTTGGAEEIAEVTPVSASFSIPAVTASYAIEIEASVAPQNISFSLPSITTTYEETYTASVDPVSVNFTTPAVTALDLYVGQVEPVDIAFSVITPSPVYEAELSASLAAGQFTFTVPNITATYIQVETAGVAPVEINHQLPSIAASYIQVETVTVSPATFTASIPTTTATYNQENTAGVTPVAIDLTPIDATATYEALFSATVAPTGIDFTIPEMTGTFSGQVPAVVESHAIIFSVPNITPDYVSVVTAEVHPTSFIFTVPDITIELKWNFKSKNSTLWTNHGKEVSIWTPKEKARELHYIILNNGDDLILQNGDLLYTHFTIKKNWSSSQKQSTSWESRDKIQEYFYLTLQNGEIIELQNEDLLYTHSPNLTIWNTKVKEF